jgi:hypothetical protein
MEREQMIRVVGGSTVLICPCGSENLHAYHVTHYVRHREDGEVHVVGSGAFHDVDEGPLHCPSSRRDAVGIRFWCENCSDRYELAVIQHKGTTFLEWRSVV